METNETLSKPGEDAGRTAKIVYLLYLAGPVVILTGLIGVIVAYVHRDGAPDWVGSHYRFQIRTFWIGALFLAASAALAVVLIGYAILFIWVLWLLVRSIKGFRSVNRGEAHPNPVSWLFG